MILWQIPTLCLVWLQLAGCKAVLSKYLSTVWSISQFYIPSNISSVAESSINFSNPTLTSQIFQQRIKLVIDGISEWRDGLSHSWKHLTFSSTIPILHQVTPVSQSSEMIIGVACQKVVLSLSLSGHEDEISKSGLGSGCLRESRLVGRDWI